MHCYTEFRQDESHVQRECHAGARYSRRRTSQLTVQLRTAYKKIPTLL